MSVFQFLFGGKGIRTPDLLIANETLYQLSYAPQEEETSDCRLRIAELQMPGRAPQQ